MFAVGVQIMEVLTDMFSCVHVGGPFGFYKADYKYIYNYLISEVIPNGLIS